MGAIVQAYEQLFIVCIIVMALLIFLCLCRAIKGPRVTDRIISANMIGTMTIMIIAILSVVLEESYLLDVCLIYAMISFLAVVVLTKVYQGAYIERMERNKVKHKKVEEKLQEEVQEVHQGEVESIDYDDVQEEVPRNHNKQSAKEKEEAASC